MTASAIAEKFDLPNATLSFHLKELHQAGLVSARQDGRFIHHAAIVVAFVAAQSIGGLIAAKVFGWFQHSPSVSPEK
jgi:DNA-binding IclR family transcriptional regulator